MKYLAIAALALSGCTAQGLVNSALPDYEQFQFRSSDGDSILSYACAPGDPSAASRAAQAHAFFERNVDALATRAAEGVFTRATEGQSNLSNAAALNREINANVEAIIDQIETRYQCLMYDLQDV